MSSSLLSGLGVGCPVLAAPMAGGPTTPELVVAAARADSLGFLAGGYLTAEALVAQITAVSDHAETFGVNLFAPNPVPVDRQAYGRYRDLLLAESDTYGVDLPLEPREDDDYWEDKIDLLVARPPAVVSFTFGIPEAAVLSRLRRTGSLLIQTVTSAAEAVQAAEAGVDALAVQSVDAGGHFGTLTPDQAPLRLTLPDLIAEILNAVRLPCLGAGGVSTPDAAAAVLATGAIGVMVGSALLLAPESGASAAHRSALLGRDRETVVTRAFTGRPARGLRNRFIDAYDAQAPAGYPALHHLTSPLRRAAAAAGDPEPVNLWAGTGYRDAVERPAADTLRDLASQL